MIGSSDGNQYETDYDITIGRPVGAPTEPAGALKTSGGTLPTPVDQKAIDELVAAAPNFANNPVIDQMTATAERSRPDLPISGVAEADPIASKKLTAEQLRKKGIERLNQMADDQLFQLYNPRNVPRDFTAPDALLEGDRDLTAEDRNRNTGAYNIQDFNRNAEKEAISTKNLNKDRKMLNIDPSENRTPVNMPENLTEEQKNNILYDDYWKQRNIEFRDRKTYKHLKNKS